MSQGRPRTMKLLRVLWTSSLLLSMGTQAWARGGGGHSFSGGSHGGSHGGGGGSGAGFLIELLFRLLFWLVFNHPILGIPVVIVIVIAIVKIAQSSSALTMTVGSSGPANPYSPPAASAQEPPRRRLEGLRQGGRDPGFSLVLFEDFLYSLYSRAQEARGSRTLDSLTPWLSGPVRGSLAAGSSTLERVEAVVVGAMRFLSVSDPAAGEQVRVTVEFEANYTEVQAAGAAAGESYYVLDRWWLARSAAAPSRTPETVRTFGCPSCGAPLDQMRGNVCGYCGKTVDTGEFDWLVERAQTVSKERRPPQLTGDTQEQGTDLPTIVDPEAAARLAEIGSRDASFAWEGFKARVNLVFTEFQAAWSDRDLVRMRPWLTDSLFSTQTYWIEAYRRAGLTNRLDDARVLSVELARVESDPYYDAVTVRVGAQGRDYTMTQDGKVVGGNQRALRSFTEYWTLVRGNGTKGSARADKVCPSCGAPLKINMAGQCEYCSSRVTSGAFDWVLSSIEQDETYTG